MTDAPLPATQPDRRTERGFTLLEALIAIAITSVAVLGVAGSVLGMLHSLAIATDRTALADDALNVVADLRAATAYDATFLGKLAGRSATEKLTLPTPQRTRTVTLTTTVTAAGNGVYVAHVTAVDRDGTTVTEQAMLTQEAPAPGSVVDDSPTASPPP